MSSFSFIQQKNDSNRWLFIAPTLLLLTHAMAGIALFIFGRRVGDLPINRVGLNVYLIVTVILGSIYLMEASRLKREKPLMRTLLLVSVPAFISLALSAALWLTRWLGSASYAPWGVGDDDVVIFLSLIFLFSWIVIALLYGSYKYLLTGGIMQIVVYFVAHALPHLSRFPEASPLGVQPGVPVHLIGLLILGGLLVSARKRVAPDFQPSLWVAVLLLTAVGSFTFYIAWSQFPENGMVLGWTETLTQPARQVPANAWNWTRPAAQALLYLAVAAVPLSGMAQWLTARKK